MRILFGLFIGLIFTFLLLQGKLMEQVSIKPAFLQTDEIADAHKANTIIKVHSLFKPSEVELTALKTDYSNLWAHLNHLYATADVEAGKEYYTEDWFKQICKQYDSVQKSIVQREDEQHELTIQNWSSDALVCAAIDSNVVFRYQYPDQTKKNTKANIAVILLYQGDHWRIDAMKVLNENIIN